MIEPLDFIHDFALGDAPQTAIDRARLHLLDLIGVGAGGSQTKLSEIISTHATTMFGGSAPMLFDGRTASPAGVALAAGMTIDSLDGHDGYNPAKGHIGCPLLGALLGIAADKDIAGKDFFEAFVMGYEFGARASVAQHRTVSDYHTSGSWGAVTAAAAVSRLLRLTPEQTRHALGIAEYHGPRSQMMRCIDHPTMVKDGSGWGAMTGVTAAYLAQDGFTGAPAITIENAPEYWTDLGNRWAVTEQYVKPYPVCRWAQAPIECALTLRRQHGLLPDQVARIEVATFHESIRLAIRRPTTTEEAQYSTSFPCAVAMVRDGVSPADIADDALDDPAVLRLSDTMVFVEDDHANTAFPQRRLAKVSLVLIDGTRLESEWMEPKWDATAPPTETEMRYKYRALANPILGASRAARVEALVDDITDGGTNELIQALTQPVSRSASSGSSD